MDSVAYDGEIVAMAISEHVENAGIFDINTFCFVKALPIIT